MSCRQLWRRTGAVLAIILLMVSLWCHSSAIASEKASGQVEQVLLSQDMGSCRNLQQLLDTELANMAGKGAEFVVLAIRQYEQGLNFNTYLTALDKYMKEAANLPTTTIQKIALVRYACGGLDHDQALATAHETEGKQGVMSIVFALHIYTNLGAESDADRCVNELLKQQSLSGGWGLSADTPTVDITAMTIQALAPYYHIPDVGSSVDKALDYLKQAQQQSGGFLSYGVENCESVAQVIMALTSLNMDYSKVMNGDFGTLLDVMLSCKLEGGGFSHTRGGQMNMTATSQAVMALVAIDRTDRGAGSIYLLEQYSFGKGELIENESKEPMEVKLLQRIVAVTIALGFGAYIFWGCVKRKFSAMDLITVSMAGLVISGFVFFSDIETPEQYYSYNLPEITEESQVVYLSIVDEDMEILGQKEYAFLDDDTVFDLVLRVTRANGISLGYVSGWEMYINAIGDLSEGDRGSGSGWVYYINGVQPQISVSSYELQPGDVVEFRYVQSYGGTDNE